MEYTTASRELDAEVAEIVVGLPKNLISINGLIPMPGSRIIKVQEISHYSRDMTAAWEVVEKLTEQWCDFSLERAGTRWHAVSPVASAAAGTAAVAICLCGLESFRTLRRMIEHIVPTPDAP